MNTQTHDLKCVTAVIVGLLLSGPAFSARQLLPPSEVFRDPVNVLVEGLVLEGTSENLLRLGKIEVLRGQLAPDEAVPAGGVAVPGEPESSHAAHQPGEVELEVRVDTTTGSRVKVGQRYIVGCTQYLKGRFPLPKLRLDPEGFRAVELAVVGAAVFSSSPSVRSLLLATPADWERTPEPLLEHLLPLLRDRSPELRRFATIELLYLESAWSAMESKEISRIQAQIEDTTEEPEIRRYLLEAAWNIPAGSGREWVLTTARKILSSTPLEVPLGSGMAALQHDVLRTVSQRGTTTDCDKVARLLYSTNPGVVQSALQTLDTLDPEKAELFARKALENKDQPEQSRRYLASYVKRVSATKSRADSDK